MISYLDSDNRRDLTLIADLVKPGSRVLDVGCGNGELLEILTTKRNVDGRGVEISQDGVTPVSHAGFQSSRAMQTLI